MYSSGYAVLDTENKYIAQGTVLDTENSFNNKKCKIFKNRQYS